jgi:hypothetical protein
MEESQNASPLENFSEELEYHICVCPVVSEMKPKDEQIDITSS